MAASFPLKVAVPFVKLGSFILDDELFVHTSPVEQIIAGNQIIAYNMGEAWVTVKTPVQFFQIEGDETETIQILYMAFEKQILGHLLDEKDLISLPNRHQYNSIYQTILTELPKRHLAAITLAFEAEDRSHRTLFTKGAAPADGSRIVELNIREKRATLPATFSWVAKKKVTAIRNQGQCGCCYAFAAVAAVESQYAIKKNQLVDLSEEQVVSCTYGNTSLHGSGGGGCNGGSSPSILQYIQDNGITKEANFKYTLGSDTKIPACVSKPVFTKITKWAQIPQNSEPQMRTYVYNTLRSLIPNRLNYLFGDPKASAESNTGGSKDSPTNNNTNLSELD